MWGSVDFPTYCSHKQGHEGADDVEETVGEIDECGDTDFAKVRKLLRMEDEEVKKGGKDALFKMRGK